jgi:hypothetical protein
MAHFFLAFTAPEISSVRLVFSLVFARHLFFPAKLEVAIRSKPPLVKLNLGTKDITFVLTDDFS